MPDGLPLPTTFLGWLYTSLVAIVPAIIAYVLGARRIPSEISLNLGQTKKAEAESRKLDTEGKVSLIDSLEDAAVQAVDRWKVELKEIVQLQAGLRDMKIKWEESQRELSIANARVLILEKEIVQLNCQAKLKP